MATDIDPLAPPAPPRTRVPLKIEEVLIAAGMAAIALITAANVVTRYLTQVSLAFTEEFSVVLMVFVTMLGSAYAFASGRHIRIPYFTDKLGVSGRSRAEIVATVLIMIMFLVLLIWGARLTWDEYRFEVTSTGMGYPQWLQTGILPLLSLAVLARCVGRIQRLLRGEPT
jgi:TRAP-type C4-dicarboxylate transport system permease small subunit